MKNLTDCLYHRWRSDHQSFGLMYRKGMRSAIETENLLTILKEGYRYSIVLDDSGKNNWTKVSDYVLERCGKMCYDRYNYLKKK